MTPALHGALKHEMTPFEVVSGDLKYTAEQWHDSTAQLGETSDIHGE